MTENIKRTILCKGKVIDLSEPHIMGILNVTPDSFYDGGKYSDLKAVLSAAEKMMMDGANFIDIGAVSTRPGSNGCDLKTEKERIEPVLKSISKDLPDAILSVDTFRSEIAEMAVEKYGVSIINDISAGNMDEKMIKTAGRLKVPFIAMHMKGTPDNMQLPENTSYSDIINEIIKSLSEKIQLLNDNGVSDIIVDPGFGFSKTIDQNYHILKNLSAFKILDCPLIAGLSRKSMIWKFLNSSPEKALTGTITAETIALLNGADILRVHDVKETAELVKIFKQYKQS